MMIIGKPPKHKEHLYFGTSNIDEIMELANKGVCCEYMDIETRVYYFRIQSTTSGKEGES